MLNGVKAMQANILKSMTDTYAKLGEKEKEIFLKTLKDGGLEAIAKDNAEKVIELNKRFHKINTEEPKVDESKKAEFDAMKEKTDRLKKEWENQFKKK